jgi:hypothetical protein
LSWPAASGRPLRRWPWGGGRAGGPGRGPAGRPQQRRLRRPGGRGPVRGRRQRRRRRRGQCRGRVDRRARRRSAVDPGQRRRAQRRRARGLLRLGASPWATPGTATTTGSPSAASASRARRTEAGCEPVGDLGKAVVEGSLLDDLDRFLQADHGAAGGHPPPPPGRQAAPEQPEYCEARSSADPLGRHPPSTQPGGRQQTGSRRPL